MVKISINRYVSRRIETTRKQIKATAQKLRNRTLKNLDQIFRMTARIARGEIKHQRSNGKMVPVTINQRLNWARVAAHVAQIMSRLSSNLDEREITTQLDELERLVKETNSK